MKRDKWLEIGQRKGWISEAFCYAHEEPPTSSVEDHQWREDLEPPCFLVFRLIDD
jgi:hypothetical protein